ncbi:protein NEDD1-like [Tribolium madens]|uniref:protein NEDD1-like n=1 Tax=Tribolium madens TaxID=41895 RepID=UPI001CF727AA|nr:protein NEDD1-like [Tribolium madens]
MSIASASTSVKFHEFPSGNVLHNYQPGPQIDGPIRSISWSKDGNWLALVPYSGLAEIISIKEQLKLIHTIQNIEDPSCASFQNTTKKNIAIGTKSGQVFVYDIKARNIKKRFPRTTSGVTHVEFTSKDNHVVAACENGEAYLYSHVQNTLSGSFKIPRSQSISALRTNPIKRNYVVAGSNEGVVAVWDIHGNKNKFFIGSHKAPVTAVAFSPVNSDLVVSTGFDRQFCFYDIGANKCIGNIFVENSMTAVDFSPDGKFVVMGSQKGKIYVYDMKNLQQPVYSFFGHNNAVEHLSFRKNEDYETSFMSLEEVKESNLVETHRSTESFNIELVCSEVTSEKTQSLTKPEDSFLAELGLDKNNTVGSNIQDSYQSNKYLMPKYTPTQPSKILQDKLFSNFQTSTPETYDFELNAPLSPIVNLEPKKDCGDNEKVNTDNLAKFIKTTVSDELKAVTEELKNEMKYQTTNTLYQTRQLFLNLMMATVKESIKVENQFNSLREELLSDVPQSQYLLEENSMLKQKIALLEEEISLLKHN